MSGFAISRALQLVRLLVFGIFAGIFGVSVAWSDERQDDELLQHEISYLQAEKEAIFVEGATKTLTAVSKVPGSVTVFTLDQIRKSNAKTIADLLRLVAGVQVRQNPMSQVITMRGFGQSPFTSRVLLLIDGVPYNDWTKGGFMQQPGLDFFPLENVKQLEVIRGPGSSLYGENAHWGIINIKTLSGEDIDGVRSTYYGGSRDTEVVNFQAGKQFNKDFSLLGAGKYLRSQFPTSFWFDEPSDPNIRATELFFKARYKNLTASYYRYDDKADGFTENLEIPGVPDAKFKSANQIKQSTDIYALKYNQDFGDGKYTFSGDLSYAERNGSHCGTCHANPESAHFDGRNEDHGFQAIGDFRFGIRAFDHHDILLGAEVRHVDAGDHSHELGVDIEPDEHGEHVNAYTKPAFYIQDVLSFMDNKINLTLGGRYDAQTYPKLFEDAFSPRAALVFSATDNLTLRAGWSKAFRFPSFSELYQNSWFINGFSKQAGGVAIPLAFFKPNPELRPEQIESAEIGAEYKFNSQLTAKLSLYHSTIHNMIVIAANLNPPPAPATFGSENHKNRAYIKGGELELQYKLHDKVHGFANWSFKRLTQEGNNVDSSGLPIEFVYAPKHQFQFGGYAGPFYGVSGAVEYSWQSEYMAPVFWYRLRGEAPHSIGAYSYLNLRLDYRPPLNLHRVKEPLLLSAYFKNVLNNQPEETVLGAERHTMPGRELFFGLELQF